ncbi:MAG TPA: hypothetical protein PK525_12840 [Anaerohalosphaeraceae bacterium]|nr:hypothetical protein [Anaerohalosphaeraceae bacterium]HRT24631.1 hypothetical protein [Anaerohalosphaeraceae bacterium]
MNEPIYSETPESIDMNLEWKGFEGPSSEYTGRPYGILHDAVFDLYDYLISAGAAFLIAVFFFFTSPECRFWGILPLWVCGTLAGSDLAAWFRNRLEVFDPKVLAGAFLYLTTFVAPLLHLANDMYGLDLYTLSWPRAFARMAVVNAFGLGIYKWVQHKIYRKISPVKSHWQIDPGHFLIWAVPVLCVSFAAAMVIRFFFSGLVKIEGQTQISAEAAGYAVYLSVLRMMGDPFVLLLITFLIVYLNQKMLKAGGTHCGWVTVLVLLFVTAVLHFIMVGLRGSRSVILTTVLAVTLMIHFNMRRFSKKWVLLGLVMVVVFLYLYGFRKRADLYGFKAFYDPQTRKQLSAELGGYTLTSTLLGDLSRADLQALMLANLTEYKDEINYKPVWGYTYAMAAAMFVPRAVWKNKPVGVKKDAGTELQGLLRGEDKSTRQYGLVGEAMLNFGYWGILPVFCVYGVIMGYFRKKLYTISNTDARLFLFPLIIIMLQNMVIQDMDNWLFALLRDGTLLFLLIFISSFKFRVREVLQ